jgi:phosphopentomutase
MAGIWLPQAFPVYPQGFPAEIIEEFERRIGRRILGNKPASGTEILKEMGEEHVRTGKPIVYTSGDSVFQIAAHEDVVPVWELYRMCEIARDILRGPYEVGRVIARPFVGEKSDYTRTTHRRDFSLPPPRPTVLDALQAHGVATTAIGKVDDLFAGQGLSATFHSTTNQEGIGFLIRESARQESGLIFANLVDFDMLYGHRNDPQGMSRALEEFDRALPALRAALRDGDLLMLTADHGNDPVMPSTDHSREYVPLLALMSGRPGCALGVRSTFADVAATIADFFGVTAGIAGKSFLHAITAA